MRAAVILSCCAPAWAVLRVNTLEAYPGYAGSLVVGGSISVETTGTGNAAAQVLTYDLKGVDSMCGSKDVTGVANACGIHIHKGTACDTAGGHWWNSAAITDDPWATIMYNGTDGTSTGSVSVTTGLSVPDVLGRTMVIHDVTGARISCSLIRMVVEANSPLEVKAFVPYPGYSGSLKVSGSATIGTSGSFASSAQATTYTFSGADSTCGTANIAGIANACGIHIHSGTSCLSASFIGGHYWNTGLIANDPWANIGYTAPGGSTSASVTVTTGLDASLVDGTVLVVHDATGARIACGVITPVVATTTMTMTTTTQAVSVNGAGGAGKLGYALALSSAVAVLRILAL